MDSIKYKLLDTVILKDFESSTTEKKYIIAHNKKHWVIAEELYLILSLLDGSNSLFDICSELGSLGINRNEDSIDAIINTYIIPKGIVEGCEGYILDEKKSKYFWFQISILKESLIKKLSFTKYPYYKVFSILLLALSIPGFYIIITSIISPSFYSSIPVLSYKDWIIIIILIISSGYIHELGHAGASMFFGVVPYSIGFAFYMTMPVLFADVSGIWILKRNERAIVDLGGIYFEHLYLSIIAFISLLLNNYVLFIASTVRYIGLIYNFNPFLKMDGYWLFTDLSGISNLHDTTTRFIKSILLKPFGVNIYEPHKELRTKSKVFFYLYVVISLMFFVFFITVLKNIVYTAFELLPYAKEDLFMIMDSTSFSGTVKSIVLYLKNYFILFISTFLVFRIIFTALRSFVLLFTNIL